MIRLPGYNVTEPVDDASLIVMYRGIHEPDGRAVLLKAEPDRDERSLTAPASLKHEYEVTRDLDVAGVLRAIRLEESRGGRVLVLEDCPGTTLRKLLDGGRLPIAAACRIGAQLAEILGRIHAHGIIHKDVSPASVLVDPRDFTSHLTNFGITVPLKHETVLGQAPARLEGTLAYMSPEQTGRMNRRVDYRSDLYSLGVVLYEMLAGRLPFEADDPLELVHHHIAHPAEPLWSVEPSVPVVLSDIVLKLMAKNAEERYQSTFGLRADLLRCIEQLEAGGAIDEFEIAQRDVAEQFRIPGRLYGRDEQVAELMSAFEQVSRGSSALMFVTGRAGTGKSALVGEVNRPIAACRGYFVQGKYDQYRRDVPYSGLIQAFQELIRKLLTESAERIEWWRERLVASLGANAQVLIDVIPELELIVGKQRPAPKLGLTEEQTRFRLTMRRFVDTLARQDHPLVVFLDDLQWAGAASIEMIQLLVTDVDTSHLLFICAYRDNEVDPAHPLSGMLQSLAEAGAPPQTIQLGSLELEHVVDLVADTFDVAAAEAGPLAELLISKTDGNAFFVTEFLKTLHRKELVSFDLHAGCWRWDLARIRDEEITDNVVELMSGKIGTLEPAARKVVQLAACIGNRFDLRTLSVVYQQPAASAAHDLRQALKDELIVPVGDGYKYSDLVESEQEGQQIVYKFLHDRVQQAAYSTIPVEQLPAIHERIGRLMLSESSEAQLEARLFDVVDHLNCAAEFLEDAADRRRLAGLNLRAGHKARSSLAYAPALKHLAVGRELVGDEGWHTDPRLTYDLHLETAQAAYLSGDYGEMERVCNVVLDRATELLDKVRIYELRIQYYNSSMQYERSVETGRRVLAMLGERFARRPTKAHVGVDLVRTKLALGGKSFERLSALPEMDDPTRLAAMRILMITSSAAYFAQPDLFPLLVFRMVRLTIRYGNAPLSAFGYVCYGLAMCAVLGDMEGGYRFGKLALEILDRFHAEELKSKIFHLFNSFIRHWKDDLTDTLGPFLEGADSGLETGDLEFFSYCLWFHCSHSLFAGDSLESVGAKLNRHHAAVFKHRQEKTHLLLMLLKHCTDFLSGEFKWSGGEEERTDFDEDGVLAVWAERRDYTSLCYGHCFRCMREYMAGNDERCLASAAVVDRYLDSMKGQAFVPFYMFYQSLASLRLSRSMPAAARGKALRRVRSNQRKMRHWARHAPRNYAHKLKLVDAELARVSGRRDAAAAAYEESARLARERGFVQDEALAHELAARFYIEVDRRTSAKACLGEARACYLRWGAPARAAALEELAQPGSPDAEAVRSPAHGSGSLDLDSILKASRALSGEIVLADLLRKLIGIAIENAGAQRGFLILVDENRLLIEAEFTVGDDEIRVMRSEPVETSDKLSPAIVAYTHRSQKTVVLNDAVKEELFVNDPYVKSRKPRSVLSAPLIKQGNVIGVLYMENNLSSGAFTEERLEVLSMLLAQAAISIENARLYTNLEVSLETQVKLTTAHGRFVPNEFLQALDRENIMEVELGDHVRKEMSILFSDIRDFTSLIEGLTPKRSFEFINGYLSRMEPWILRHGGFIDSYIGDAIMALFDESADSAVQAAIGMAGTLEHMNDARAATGESPLRIGIGINTGRLMLGTIGGENQLKCSVIGDSVNLASRVESLTKRYNTTLLLSEYTLKRLTDPGAYAIRVAGRVVVVGKSEPFDLYEVLDAEPPPLRDAKRQTLADFNEATRLYFDRHFESARALFERCLDVCPADGVAGSFAKLCARYQGMGVGDDWDGVERLDHK